MKGRHGITEHNSFVDAKTKNNRKRMPYILQDME